MASGPPCPAQYLVRTMTCLIRYFQLAKPWMGLVILTFGVTAGMRFGHVPGALMLGPMVSGIAVAMFRPGLQLPAGSTVLAQAVLGALVASILSPDCRHEPYSDRFNFCARHSGDALVGRVAADAVYAWNHSTGELACKALIGMLVN